MRQRTPSAAPVFSELGQLLVVMEDARLGGDVDALARLGAEAAAWLGVSEVGGDDLGLWCRIEVPDAEGQRAGQRMRWLWPGTSTVGVDGQRKVTVHQGLWLGEAPVTRALWAATMGTVPGHGQGDHPVTQVSFDDGVAFCGLLAQRFPRLGLRFPAEVEWEHAASIDATACGGVPQSGPGGLAWHRHHSSDLRGEGSLQPSPGSCFDTLDPLWEWCSDPGERTRQGRPHRILLRRSWGRRIGCAVWRRSCAPSARSDQIGLRLAGGEPPERTIWHGTVARQHVAVVGGTAVSRAALAARLAAAVPDGVLVGPTDQVRCVRTANSELFVWPCPHDLQRTEGSGAQDLRGLQAVAWCDVVLVDVCAEEGFTSGDLEWVLSMGGVLGERTQQVIAVISGTDDAELLALARDEAETMLGVWSHERSWSRPACEIPCTVRVVVGAAQWSALAELLTAIVPREIEQGAVFAASIPPTVVEAGTRIRGVLVSGALAEGSVLAWVGLHARVSEASEVPGPGAPRATGSAYLELTLTGDPLEAGDQLPVLSTSLSRFVLIEPPWSRDTCELLERTIGEHVHGLRCDTHIQVEVIEPYTYQIHYNMGRNSVLDLLMSCTVRLRPGATSIELSGLGLHGGGSGGRAQGPSGLCQIEDVRPTSRGHARRLEQAHRDRGSLELVRAVCAAGLALGYVDPPVVRSDSRARAHWRRLGWRSCGPDLWTPSDELLAFEIPYLCVME